MTLSRRWWGAKYALEWIAAIIGLVTILPLLLVLSIIVKATSRGPALYITGRLGRSGRTFNLYKFRSMKVNAPLVRAKDGKAVTLENDPRLTVVGRFLRLGFDELPQLFNVVKGDMCLIGPRPDLPCERDRYSEREKQRLAVLPGITGLAQVVNGRVLGNAENYELDVRYVTESWWGEDVMIALLTVPYAIGMNKIGQKMLAKRCHDIIHTLELQDGERHEV